MGLQRIIAVRIGMGLAVAWAVLTLVFALFTLTDDWVMAEETIGLRWAGAESEVIEAVQQQYLAARGLDRPLWQAYLDYLGNMGLLNWGESFETGEPALSIVIDGVTRTAAYVVPSVLIAITLGIGIGLFAALNHDSALSKISVVGTYLLFVVPMFWIASVFLSLNWPSSLNYGYSNWTYDHALPIVLTTITLLGGYVSYARAHSREYVSRDFTKLVRAKGANKFQVARHVMRNAAIPFFSMLFTEALGLIILAVFVLEVVFGIEGFGIMILDAARQRDLPVLMGGAIVIIAVGVLGNIIQDIGYSYFDPRVDTGRRY